MQPPTDKQLLGLPRYAQQYITDLEQRVAWLRTKVSQGPEDSNVRIRAGYNSEAPDQLLGKNARVTFDMVDITRIKSGEPMPKSRIDIQHQGLHRLSINGFPGKMAVHPYSTNLVVVTVEGY